MNNNTNKNKLKAIETEHNGHLFRSRLEARWSVLLCKLGIAYEYEKEGYQLDSGWYLPDFWLPGEQVWLEIKGSHPTKLELTKLKELSILSGNTAFLCHGSNFAMDDDAVGFNVDSWSPPGDTVDWESFYTTISYESISIGGLTPMEAWNKTLGECIEGIDLIVHAVRAAKQARFEHGAKGTTR